MYLDLEMFRQIKSKSNICMQYKQLFLLNMQGNMQYAELHSALNE